MKKYLFMVAMLSLFFTGLTGQTTVPVGSGSYTTVFPGADIAGRNSFPSGTPYLSGQAATKPVPTNDWWSNLIKEAHGGQAFNYPLSYRSYPEGLAVNYTMPYGSTNSEYRSPMDGVFDGIIVGVEGLNAPFSSASDHSDWTATINWQNDSHDFSALIGHGMPFTYFTKGSSDTASVTIGFNEAGAYVNGNKIIIENNYRGANYIVYGPSGSTWTKTGNVYTSSLNGENYWSLVMVPFDMTISEAESYFEEYAYVFPTETRISWNYDESTSVVRTDFTITPTIKEGSGSRVFWGILPHHWGNLAHDSAQPDSLFYNTVRGELKVLTSNTFSTELRYSGILPTLPDLGKYSGSFDPADVQRSINALKSSGLPTWTDSYNQGQNMNRLIQTARVADQLGNTEARDEMLETIRERLEDWLTYEPGEVAFLFYYNDDWKALLGYPAGHRQDSNLNDHHFHWGYFIHAAAFIEQYNPGWAAQWGEMINLLIRDAANPSRTDDMFPFLRNYSPYAGHSWANGFASEPFGNDQESTSESMQFNSALIHWGTITGTKEIRDLGIFLYTSEQSSVNEYWFDQNNRTFQPEYGYEMVARIWGGGYDNGTWWTTDVAASYGIQLYPIHGGSLYLGHNTDYVQEAWNGMTSNTDVLNNVPNDNLWYDTYWKFLSFLDADQALELYNNYRDRNIKFGISDAHTYQWLHAMAALGQVAEEITADYPIAAAFSKNGQMTYAAHNYGADAITVHFSDGYDLYVPGRSRATSRDVNGWATLEASEVEILTGGTVTLTARVSGTISKVEFYKDGVLLETVDSAPYTITTGSLSAGFPGFYVKAYVGSGFNLSNVVSVQVGSQLPYSGAGYTLPGTIETGNYDVFEGGSGQGIAYFDVTAWNEGGYRPEEAVDAATDNNEGATVGWIEGNEWLEYTVTIEETGNYTADIRYANGNGANGGPFHFELDGVRAGEDILVPPTGDWGAWSSYTVRNIPLTEGKHVLKIHASSGGFNLGRIMFTNENSPPPVLTSIVVTPANVSIEAGQTQQFSAAGYDQYLNRMDIVPGWSATGGSIDGSGLYTSDVTGDYIITASSGTVSAAAAITVIPEHKGYPIPGIIQAEDYEDMSGIQLEGTGDVGGGENVGWIDAGDWMDYKVNVENAGVYTVKIRVAAEGAAEKTVELRSGDTTLSTVSFTATGGWQSWETASSTLELSAGVQTIRLYASSTGYNINWLEFTPLSGPVLTKIVVSPSSATINQGETQQFTAAGYDQNGNLFETSFTWSATGGVIDNTGLYTAGPEGTFTVTAASGSVSAGVVITVIKEVPVLTSIEISPSSATIHKGETSQFTATGYDQNGNVLAVSCNWSATGGTIDNSGLYTADTEGTFTVTAASGPVSARAVIKVIKAVPVLTTIVVSPEVMTIKEGETQQFIARGYDQDGTLMPIAPAWSGTNNYGLFTGTEEGTFTITAHVGQVSGSAAITVEATHHDCGETIWDADTRYYKREYVCHNGRIWKWTGKNRVKGVEPKRGTSWKDKGACPSL